MIDISLKTKPPSGTITAVSSFPVLQDNGNVCADERDICMKTPGPKDRECFQVSKNKRQPLCLDFDRPTKPLLEREVKEMIV